MLIAAATDYRFTSNSGTQHLYPGDIVRVADDYTGGGLAGAIYRFKGGTADADLDEKPDGVDVALGTANYADGALWEHVTIGDDIAKLRELLPPINVTASESAAGSGLLAMNDIRSEVKAHVDHATVGVGSLVVLAEDTATIAATVKSYTHSSGGSVTGKGGSLAISGVVATNRILSKANAYLTFDGITTDTGGVDVTAHNHSSINADINSELKATRAGTAVGVTLAFNTIGIAPQNFLFNLVDVLGAGIGVADPAAVKAYIDNSTINSAGGIHFSAVSEMDITATIETKITSAQGVGVTLALNKIATDVEAYILGFDDRSRRRQATSASRPTDHSLVDAKVKSPVVAIGFGKKDTTEVGIGLNIARNDIDNDMAAYIKNAPLVKADAGNILVTSAETAVIKADAAASAFGIVAVGGRELRRERWRRQRPQSDHRLIGGLCRREFARGGWIRLAREYPVVGQRRRDDHCGRQRRCCDGSDRHRGGAADRDRRIAGAQQNRHQQRPAEEQGLRQGHEARCRRRRRNRRRRIGDHPCRGQGGRYRARRFDQGRPDRFRRRRRGAERHLQRRRRLHR